MNTLTDIVIGLAILCALYVLAVLLFRGFVLRTAVTSTVFRAGDGAGWGRWNHGAFKYTESELRLYRLLSARWSADIRIPRSTICISSRRSPVGDELARIEASDHIVLLCGGDSALENWEVALGEAAHIALVSWVESYSAPTR